MNTSKYFIKTATTTFNKINCVESMKKMKKIGVNPYKTHIEFGLELFLSVQTAFKMSF